MPAKKLETVYSVTASANVASLLALDDPANPNRFSIVYTYVSFCVRGFNKFLQFF